MMLHKHFAAIKDSFEQVCLGSLVTPDDSLPYCFCGWTNPRSFPSLKISLGDVSYTIQANSLVIKDGFYCYLMIKPADSWVLGMPFLRSVYAVFDLERQ